MATFDETPQVVFEVKDDDGNVIYRDAITYATMAELRQDNAAERQVKFQQRYDDWLVASTTPSGDGLPPEEG